MWIAFYQPASEEDLTKRGFKTKKETLEYVRKYCCLECRLEEKKHNDLLHTACGMEWFVMKEKDFDKCDSHMELMEANGWKPVKRKEVKEE